MTRTSHARETIFGFVRAHPAVHVRELERQLGLSNKLAIHHLQRLEEEGRVARVEHDGYTRFLDTQTASRLAPEDLDVLCIARRPPALRALVHLVTQGESPQNHITRTVGLAKSSVTYHLRLMERAGIVHARSEGRERRYRLAEPARVRELLRRFPPLPGELDAFSQMWADVLS